LNMRSTLPFLRAQREHLADPRPLFRGMSGGCANSANCAETPSRAEFWH
jgi:hypothetical protein